MRHATRSTVLLAAVIAIAGCGGSAAPLTVPSAGTPRGSSFPRQASHGVSWMGKGVKQQDLLYVSNVDGVVNVYRYWQHTLVGVLTSFKNPLGECTNAAGDVYIADEKRNKVYEYVHGATHPVNVIDDSPYHPEACAVSSLTGDLAVANYGQFSNAGGNVAVYRHGSGKPVLYEGANTDHFNACAYDRRGDLLAASAVRFSDYYYTEFDYLPKRGVKLLPITLPGPSQSWVWGYNSFVFWDGKYWVVSSYETLYRFTIDVKAQYVSATDLEAPGGAYINQVTLYKPAIKSRSFQVVGAGVGTFSNDSFVDYWNYPAGGNPVAQLSKGLDKPYGVAISLGAQ